MNKKILAPLFVAASFLLVGCSTSTIVGRPGWINEDIIDVGGIKNNKMKELYDAIKNLGDTNSNVLNKVMYQIAQKQLGTFEELKKFKEDSADINEFKAFIDAHKMYQPDEYSAFLNAQGKIETVESKNLSEADRNKIIREKIKKQYDAIINRVCEMMYNEVKGGSYTTDGVRKLFSEEEYVRHLNKELYHPVVADGTTFNGQQVFLPKPMGVEWKDFVNYTGEGVGFLHILSGNEFTEIYHPKTKGEEGGYIGRKILPDVYRELLIENYVREQRYTNLGRGYARKVKMIKIEGGNNVTPVQKLLTNYAKAHITGDGTALAAPDSNGFDGLNKAMIGILKSSDTTLIGYLTAAGFEDTGTTWKTHVNETGGAVTATNPAVTTQVYRGTKLGDLIETVKKAYNLIPKGEAGSGEYTFQLKFPVTEEVNTAYNDLTNNGIYPIEVGLELKERELFSTDLTQDGWFMKDGGLTDLNDDFRNDLFNIKTSNIVDDNTSMTISETTGSIGWGTYKTGDTSRYFQLSDDSKHAYLLGEGDNPWEAIVLQDTSNNFYVVEIEEAASLAKLSPEDERSYIRLRATTDVTHSAGEMNEIVRGITKQVANGDTYKKNAEQYYLMISNIIFYDQSIYDYFKSQFPELFK